MSPSPEQNAFARAAIMQAKAVLPVEDEWMAPWMAAIACLESGWGKAVPEIDVPVERAGETSHNYIGYHWIEGRPWSVAWASCPEGGTGEIVRYRVYESPEACFRSLYWLIKTAPRDVWSDPRKDYGGVLALSRALKEHAEEIEKIARRQIVNARYPWMHAFSKAYCPGNERHGPDVESIFNTIQNL
jgi:hypothetical protein